MLATASMIYKERPVAKKFILIFLIALCLPNAAMAQEIVEITSDDIILLEPYFTDFIKGKMPFYQNKLVNLEKERPVKHLKVEFSDFEEFWKILKTYYSRVDSLKKNIEEFEQEALVIREKLFEEPSLASSSAVKRIISYKFLKKNINYSKKVIETLGKDIDILSDVLKTSSVRAIVSEVTDLKTYAGAMVNAIQDLKSKKIDFKTFENINLPEIKERGHADHLNKQFLKLAIELTGAFHVASEIDRKLKSLSDVWQKVYNYEFYVLENKRITFASLLNTSITILVLLIIYHAFKIFFKKVVNDRGRAYAINTLGKYIIAIAIFMVFLSGVGLDLSKITLLVSAMSVGIGFGLTTIVSNFISGILLLLEGSVKVHDMLKLEDGSIVTVEEIGLRKSVLSTLDHVDIVVPNVDLVGKKVINLTYMKKPITRNRINFSVNPAVDFNKLEKVAIESAIRTLGGSDKVVREDPALLVSGLETNAINCELLVYVDNVANFIPDAKFKKNLMTDFAKNKLNIFLTPVSQVKITNK